MPTYLEKKSDSSDDGRSAKVTVVKIVASEDSIDSKSEKCVGSDESIEKETKELDDSINNDLKKRYV